MIDCDFELNGDGLWQCPNCRWTYYRKCDEPPRRNCPKAGQTRRHGPGWYLARLLKRFGVTEKAGCRCKQRAQMMDQRGPNWCEKNTDTIVGWMQEEAKRRRLPFVGYVAKLLVRRAIKLTRMEVEGDPGGR